MPVLASQGSLNLLIPFPRHRRHHSRVNKLCIFVGTTIGSYVGWWAGEQFGFDFFGNFMLSGVGSILGVYAGWKLARKLSE